MVCYGGETLRDEMKTQGTLRRATPPRIVMMVPAHGIYEQCERASQLTPSSGSYPASAVWLERAVPDRYLMDFDGAFSSHDRRRVNTSKHFTNVLTC